MQYKGSCHCGKLAYEVEADISSLLECNCSICSKRGYQLFFVPEAGFKLSRSDVEPATYTFNAHKIKHQFCPECGVGTFGIGSDPEGNVMMAVNARTLDDVDLSQVEIQHYDGKSA